LSITIGLLPLFNALVAGQILVILLGIFMAIGGIVAIVWAFRACADFKLRSFNMI
jgi:uncharacterized membrane protein HdeD (DUF308 family)